MNAPYAGSRLASADALEQAVGTRPPGWHLKSIPLLDEHCLAFLDRSTFAVLGGQHDDGSLWSVALGGRPVEAVGTDRVRIDLTDGAPGVDTADGVTAALLCLVPGYRETLRINGRLHGSELVVEEAFLHCAKCMIRSRLWEGEVSATSGPEVIDGADLTHPEVAGFLARSPFVTLTSTDAAHHSDVSPKGDPPGFVLPLGPTTLALPDRPGNRRTDTFHNLLEHPQVALLALVPGDDRVLHVHGAATVTDDAALRSRSEVKGNVPHAMLVVEVAGLSLQTSAAAKAAGLWEPAARRAGEGLPRASRIWTDHVKLNDDPGVGARIGRAAVKERVLRAGLAADYRNNLY